MIFIIFLKFNDMIFFILDGIKSLFWKYHILFPFDITANGAAEDSDAEFEEMLKIKDDDNSDDVKVVREKSSSRGGSSKKAKSSGKAKMKIGSKNKKKGKKKVPAEEIEHQEYCEVCTRLF